MRPTGQPPGSPKEPQHHLDRNGPCQQEKQAVHTSFELVELPFNVPKPFFNNGAKR
jgi:hypothetical protein